MKNTLQARIICLLLVVVFIITNSCIRKSTDAISETTSSVAQSGSDEEKQTFFKNITPVQSSGDSKATYTALPAHQLHVYLLVLVRF